VPLTTIGGEPGGRAAKVVEDKAAEGGAVGDGEHTSAMGATPEPGPNVFEGEPDKEAKKSHEPPSEVRGALSEERVISEVKTVDATTSTDGGTSSSSPATPTTMGGAAAQEGPMPEEEALADRVAKELYPEAGKRR